MTRLTETKSVKVDNWGVFFLQKLQNFFNKTDHCDLTLQFNDNSQLKVHRLVLSACTDYFNMLESTCEMYDDVLIMPLDLQADVIVPIVNFMYTGTLEFQYGIYEKLLKTAKDMSMTVLLKLLEAHKQTTRINQNVGRQPVLLNKQAPSARGRNPQSSFHSAPSRSYGAIRQPAPVKTGLPQRPAVTMVKHQTTIAALTPSHKGQAPDPHALVSKYGAAKGKQGAGPTRFDESGVPETLEGNFDDISYESTPLVTADQIKKEEETSPFEKLRKGYTNVAKRPAPVSFSTPAAKKPNLQEVKEFTEAARLRSQLAADDDDSPGIADDTQFDDDEEEEGQQSKQLPTKPSPNLKQIVIKQEPKTSPGGGGVKQITVKDESGSVDHAKIISEVLKKYPHLVKKNKNIKLKIMQKTSPQAQSASASATPSAPVKMEVRTATPLKADISMVRRATEAIRQPAAPAPTPSTPSSGPKKIDSKTMHALIAKGAENMTGPWLCLRCGIDGRPISIPSYKAFRNHLIVKHKEKIDARICEHCGWRAEQRNPNLFYHWLTEHNIKSTIKFPTCAECGHVAMNATLLAKHEEENHQRGDLQQCIYCNKLQKAINIPARSGNVVMVLNDDQFITGAGLQLEDGTELINAGGSTAEGGQNSNIMVMYSQAGDELATQSTVTTTTVAASSAKVKEVQNVASVVEEEETSQASTQPSEKEVEAASEKGEDSQMSVDPESSQDKGADDTRDSEVDQEEEAARLAKEEEEKAAKEKEKLKLISELEGDWSEDTEEQPAAVEPEPEPVQEEEAKKVEVPAEKEKTAPSKSKEDPKKQEAVAAATEEAANEKEIDRLLDEWHSEVKADEAEEAETADADLEKKLEKVVGEEKTEEEPPAKEDEEPVAAPAEEAEPSAATTSDQTPDVSVDEASMNDSETTQVVIVAAESETDTSMREDETSQQEEEANSFDEKKQVEEEEAAKEDEPEAKDNGEAAKEKVKGEEDGDDEAKEPEEDKTKSKEHADGQISSTLTLPSIGSSHDHFTFGITTPITEQASAQMLTSA
ncbi:microtubule binding protein [Culex quinquefasciatus]|uniref:Microtubule binding protein n=1 Tax=Culex quinquefasciatus TaxID=7176 RepID=B0X3M0_CULQU|nr:microtubule binding protein [Culex quinquefasciatus]|eukprot:XP_001864242.1 microtubule binding protein [Culex quinquefasciatus]